jgi:hypothetical protein
MLAHDLAASMHMTMAGSRAGCIGEESRGDIGSAGDVGYIEGIRGRQTSICVRWNVLKSVEDWLE